MKISFDLHVLGWKAFEDLVSCMFRDILGQTVQTFSDGPDGGRDAAFGGVWAQKNSSETFSGSFCIQCKHTSKPSTTLSIAVVEDELEKISRLAAAGLCDNYFLVTNRTLPAGVAEEAEAKIVNAGAKVARVFGAEWIYQVISESPRLRRLVPRLYGLGDLTQIITNQAYAQAREVLDSIAPDLACFVPTAAYRQCAHSLKEHGFVLLLGEPASGKTMIANLMALSAADEWDLQTLMITGPSDFSNLWNPNDPGQFLWVDDAFGATQYDANRVNEWNQLLPKLKAAIKNGARVVFTSRDYIFQAAKRDLKIGAFELFDDSRVVIRVERLSESERQMILYGHLKSGSQPIKFKASVKPFLEQATQVSKFLPEIARRFGNTRFTKNLPATREGVLNFFERPLQVLLEVVGSLAAAEKAAIGLVFISGGKLPIPVAVDQHVTGTLELLDVTIGEVKAALVSLDDSLLKRIRDHSAEFWVFRHPTIRDAFATLVGGNPELIDVYLAGVSPEQLLKEVVCGDHSIEGSKIIVPSSRYKIVLEKLEKHPPPSNFWSDPVWVFLSSRCSANFIAQYFSDKDVAACIPTGTWGITFYDSGLGILAKLNKAGLLSEEVRQKAVKKIIDISEREYSCDFAMSKRIMDLLTEDEVNSALKKICGKLIDGGAELIGRMKNDWDNETDPSDHFYDIDRTLQFMEYDERFDAEAQAGATDLRRVVEDLVSDLKQQVVEPSYEELETENAPQATISQSRSVFDDVDQ